jgi:ankyrin repeat protein
MHAALNGHLDLARQLVKRGARVNRPGWSPLHYAASGGHLEVIRWLFQQKADLNALSANGTTPLMIAARERREAAADLLVALGADPTLHNAAGFDAAGYFDRSNFVDASARMRAASDAFEARRGQPRTP